jgi:hypothetical protein
MNPITHLEAIMASNRDELAASWSREEFGTIDLGDKRLTERLIRVADELESQPQSSINAACGDWTSTKAAYRLFNNEKVTAQKILAAHFQQTVARMENHSRVFAIQDTTFLDYTHHPLTEGLGPIGTKKQNIYGFVKHTTVVFTESGVPLGCLTDKVWVREDGAQKPRQSNPPITEKESYKWIEALNQTKAQTPEGVEVICICDREADIYQFFVEAGNTPFVIRAAQNRRVDNEIGKLNDLVKSQPCAGELGVKVPKRDGHPARTATLSVHFVKTRLLPPHRTPAESAQKLPPVDVHIVCVTEPNPPVGTPPLQWLLITNVEVRDFADAVERIRWYSLRWHIEVYFKVLKSGTKIEGCRLATQARLFPYFALMSVIGWRLYWVTMYNRYAPSAACTCVLTDDEWKALYCVTHKTMTLPKKLPTVSEVVIWIAKLGGFLARKSDGVPGVTVIWRGWQRLSDISATFSLIHTAEFNDSS